MDVSALYRNFTVSPVQPVSAVSPVAGAVDTILPQSSQSVGAAGSSASSGSSTDEAKSGPLTGDSAGSEPTSLKGRFSRDSATSTMVFQAIDSRTEQVVLQVPDEQLLKLRTFIAEMKRREVLSRQPNTDSHVA
ncbi:MAG: flagellar protein FlaG [Bradyrhizobium sp.]|nr:flagellar protein FlaG [Bradyrhizobium sp.]